MKILALVLCLGAIGALMYNLFKKDDTTNNSNGGGYTGVNDGVEGELPKDTIQ